MCRLGAASEHCTNSISPWMNVSKIMMMLRETMDRIQPNHLDIQLKQLRISRNQKDRYFYDLHLLILHD
ncbi:hypothetical protein Hanom_Chr02g00172961 [Helianthus anomalus]